MVSEKCEVVGVAVTNLSGSPHSLKYGRIQTFCEARPQLWPRMQSTQVYASTTALVTFPNFEMPRKSFTPPEVNVRPWVITRTVTCSTSTVSLLVYAALGYFAGLEIPVLGGAQATRESSVSILGVTLIGRFLT